MSDAGVGGVGGVCCVYEDDVWLPAMVEGCYPALDRLFFLVGRHPWNGPSGSNASTLAAIRSCHDPESKIVVIEGDWPDEAAQRNAGLEICARAGLSFCCVIDADEIYDAQILRRMIQIARGVGAIDLWQVTLHTYWKSYRFRIDPPEPASPAVLVRVGRAPFVRNRQVASHRLARFPREYAVCHHMSYARTDEQVRNKLLRFSHAHQILPCWFEDVWQRWDRDSLLEDLHPVWPRAYKRAVPQDQSQYPPALRRLYDREHAASNSAAV